LARKKHEENGHANGEATVTLNEALDAPPEPQPLPPPEDYGEGDRQESRNTPAYTCRMSNIKGNVWANYDDQGRVATT